MGRTVLMYGDTGDGLVFIEQELAQDLATLRTNYDTWGQARAALAPSRWREIEAQLEESEIPVPDLADPYDLDIVPGFADGDWPEWPKQLMLAWMPKPVIEQFGTAEATVFNGDFLSIDPKSESEVVAALESAGWSCIKDELLVCRASGL